jgi:hypothetical protein
MPLLLSALYSTPAPLVHKLLKLYGQLQILGADDCACRAKLEKLRLLRWINQKASTWRADNLCGL